MTCRASITRVGLVGEEQWAFRACLIHTDGPGAGARAFPPRRVGFRGEGSGWRILAYKDGGRVRLVSRNGRDHTRRFAEIAAAVAKLFPHSLVFDGEVAIYD